MRSVSLNEESTRDIQEKIKSNYYKEKWNFIVGQEGITQLILKGENDTKDYIIQFNKVVFFFCFFCYLLKIYVNAFFQDTFGSEA
jgi:hypothetical protein